MMASSIIKRVVCNGAIAPSGLGTRPINFQTQGMRYTNGDILLSQSGSIYIVGGVGGGSKVGLNISCGMQVCEIGTTIYQGEQYKVERLKSLYPQILNDYENYNPDDPLPDVIARYKVVPEVHILVNMTVTKALIKILLPDATDPNVDHWKLMTADIPGLAEFMPVAVTQLSFP